MSRRLSVASVVFVYMTMMACLGMEDCGDKNPVGPSGSLSVACSASAESGRAPFDVRFTAKVSGLSDKEMQRVAYKWSFGDGTTASTASVSKTFLHGGTYNVTLTATHDGDTGVWQTTIRVDSDLRIDSCSAEPSSGKAPLAVQFRSQVVGNGQNPITYAWDFGDGGTAADARPAHTYGTVGNYTAVLTARSAGSSVQCSVPVGVFDSLDVTCSASPTSGDAPLSVSFDANAGDGSCSYSWDFDDGWTSDKKAVTHRYDLGRLYYPTVTATCGARRGSCRQRLDVTGPAPTPLPTRTTPPPTSPSPGTSPTASPTASVSPTATPIALACSGTHTYNSTDTPVTVPGETTGRISVIDTDLFVDNCRPTNLRISFHMTSDIDLSTYAWTGVQISYQWGGNDWLTPYGTSGAGLVSGTSLGSSCGSLVFAEGAANFSTATPPYDGTFAPLSPWDLQPEADATGQYRFYISFTAAGHLTLQCWSVTFDATPF